MHFLNSDPPIAIITYNEMAAPLHLVFNECAPGPTIMCLANGYPPPTLEWIQDSGRGLPSGISQSTIQSGEVQLIWQRPIQLTDSGSYICQASNSQGRATAEVLVQSEYNIICLGMHHNMHFLPMSLLFSSATVEPAISSIYPFNSNIVLDLQTFTYTVPLNYVGSTLVCEARGWPVPEVEWQKNGQTLTSYGGVVSEPSAMSASVSARLTWTREFLNSDTGSYQCVVRELNTIVPVASHTIFLKAGSSTQTGPSLTCSVQGPSIYFQIRILELDCESWEESLTCEIHNNLLAVIKTECGCEVDDSEVLGSPQCSSKVDRAVVFRGQIQTNSTINTWQIFCALYSWQRRTPLIQINGQFQAVDDSCSLKASSLNSEECNAPKALQSTFQFGVTEITALISGVAVCVTVVVVLCLSYWKTRKKTIDGNNVPVGDHTYDGTHDYL